VQTFPTEELATYVSSPKIYTPTIVPKPLTYCRLQFAAIVIQGMGFSTNKTFLVSMIVTGFQGFFVIASTLGRHLSPQPPGPFGMAICTVIALVGAVVIRQVNNSHIWARYSGYCLLSAYTANFPLLLSLNVANVAGITKKTTANAMVRLLRVQP
jgi:hypothetical protein